MKMQTTRTPREEMLELRRRIQTVEDKLSLIYEPMLMDALAYELLGLQARMNFLIADAKRKGSQVDKMHNY